jgi:hypothetical protein
MITTRTTSKDLDKLSASLSKDLQAACADMKRVGLDYFNDEILVLLQELIAAHGEPAVRGAVTRGYEDTTARWIGQITGSTPNEFQATHLTCALTIAMKICTLADLKKARDSIRSLTETFNDM